MTKLQPLVRYSVVTATALLIFASSLPCAEADDGTKDRFIGSAQQALRADPGGSSIGTIFPGTPVKHGETRGRWAQVFVEAWVPVDALQDALQPTSSGQATNAPSANAPLALVDYDVKSISKDTAGDKPRVQIKITLKNNSPRPISSWQGLLVAQQVNGPVLFRLPVSDDTQTIAPGATAEVNFYWAKGEQFYDALLNETKQSVQVMLFKPIVQ